ncbi:hypothetical protein QJQ45_000679 [Haematococcus lacustris]|nr:hypothetical protein QJQ45_000679 [Haematococcus lacustris]
MHHQAGLDGGASATDGYSPAGEAPPPATKLLDLPPTLLDDIACRAMQLGARRQLPLTCRAFSLAHLLHVPALSILIGRQHNGQLLTPRVIAPLQARTSKLALSVPTMDNGDWFTDLVAHTMVMLDKCPAVEVCRLSACGTPYWESTYRDRDPFCLPDLAQRLVDSFPNLTALKLYGFSVTCSDLASLLSHPRLSLQLQQLDLTCSTVKQPQQPGSGPVTLDPFQGARLQHLVFYGFQTSTRAGFPPSISRSPLPNLQPLAQHLTQLHLKYELKWNEGSNFLLESLRPLAQLQVLTLSHLYKLEGLTELLQALPQLHTLQLPGTKIQGQQQLNALLAATQITSLQLDTVEAIDTSCADAPCSWQRLEISGGINWKELAYLPLHSLSQPLVLDRLHICEKDISNPQVATALYNMAYACKVPVKIKSMGLTALSLNRGKGVGSAASGIGVTPASLQQQRVDLAQLVALLQPLQCCEEVLVWGLHQATAADVVALAPLCQDCTHFALEGCGVKPSLEFWRQLVQLMPTVHKVTFMSFKKSSFAAMHESLQLMAEQPWARWLDITLHVPHSVSKLPASWQVDSWYEKGVFKVTME